MGLSKLWGKDSSGAHGFVFSHIKAIYYNFSQNKLLSTKLDEMDAKDTATDNKIGNLSDLTTSVKSSVVAAITEVVSDMGDLSDLDSSVKTSLVAAINEALGNAQTAQNSVGTLSSLTTTAKTSAVAAINELNSKIQTQTQTLDGNISVTYTDSIATLSINYSESQSFTAGWNSICTIPDGIRPKIPFLRCALLDNSAKTNGDNHPVFCRIAEGNVSIYAFSDNLSMQPIGCVTYVI